MKRLRLRIVKKYISDVEMSDCPGTKQYGWVIVADNGDLPEEGDSHPTREEARKALYAMYDNTTWGLTTGRGYYINIE